MNFTYDGIDVDLTLDEKQKKIVGWLKTNTFKEIIWLEFLRDKKIITPESIVVDVGSYIGNHVVYFSKILGAKKVIAFEPTPRVFDILQENIKNNNLQNIEAYNLAVSSKSGYTKCKVRKENNPAKNKWYRTEKYTPECVQSVTLSKHVSEKVDFIKIDNEEMEMEALMGGIELIKKYSPYLMVEVSKANLGEFETLMKKLNYNRIGKKTFTLKRGSKINNLLLQRKR